jgi:hypothetical protein
MMKTYCYAPYCIRGYKLSNKFHKGGEFHKAISRNHSRIL